VVVRFYLLSLLFVLAACASGLGGADYAPQYDFFEFWAATDGRTFRVETAGNPFPGLSEQQMRQRLLPVMQANKPRPRLTFTYERPPDTPNEAPHPDYYMVLVFNPALDMGAAQVCAGQRRLGSPQPPGKVYLFAVYCRSDQYMSQTTAWTDATSPDDPKVGQMFAVLFQVLFTDQPVHHWQRGPFSFMRL
jgi:hypothetical protein